jgi:ATP/maltotriose-dependent transcriptional regulator MalT
MEADAKVAGRSVRHHGAGHITGPLASTSPTTVRRESRWRRATINALLYGRDAERALIGGLLEAARASRSGVLVLRGEAGVGKSALLEDARERALDMQVLSCSGIESETQLPFAALHQLLRPILSHAEKLPQPQAGALRGALGLAAGGGDDRFLVSLAVLSLLAEAAEERPLLCLVDDAHWLDDASADAFVFVARRLEAEGIVLLFATREGEPRQFEALELPELQLGGLDAEAAGALLERQAGLELAPEARELLVERTGGHPLALLELASSLTEAELRGGEPLLTPLPVSARLERAFLARVRALPEETQTLLLVAAADDSGDLATVLRAAAQLGVEVEALDAAEQAGLARVRGRQLELHHPLVRSAVYHAAPLSKRQAAHRALAAVLDGEVEADRRAWHRAAASLAPDPSVVNELEQAAERARRRSGFAAASLAFERAAALTEDESQRARRLTAAAENAWLAGQLERVSMLLERTRPLTPEPMLRADIDRYLGLIELTDGAPADACQLFQRAATEVAAVDGDRALQLLNLASVAALYAGDGEAAVAIAELARTLVVEEMPLTRMLVQLLIGLGAHYAGDFERAAISLRSALAVEEELEDDALARQPVGLLFAGRAAFFLGDDHAAARIHREAAARARASGALGVLTQILPRLALAEVWLSRLAPASANASEGLRLARETHQDDLIAYQLAMLALIAAYRGNEDECRSLGAESHKLASAHGFVLVAEFARWALALLELGLGRADEAFRHALDISTSTSFYAALDRIEAAVRAGHIESARDWLDSFEPWAETTGAAWARAVVSHCCALLSQDEQEAERLFQTALELQAEAGRPFERARTELAFGEFLRRARRRVEAREHLHAALDGFETLGAELWAERARIELRASGQTARRRHPSTRGQLTAQELQIAHFVAQGLSNREVAAQLFLSPRTVAFHLRNIFRKLGISSRTELARLDLQAASEAPAQPTDPAVWPARA